MWTKKSKTFILNISSFYWFHIDSRDQMTSLNSSPPVLHICVGELGQHWFRWWLVACSTPSLYLTKCWFIVKCTLRNKRQWNSNRNTIFFIHVFAFKNLVCEMAAIMSRGRWVKTLITEILQNRKSLRKWNTHLLHQWSIVNFGRYLLFWLSKPSFVYMRTTTCQ